MKAITVLVGLASGLLLASSRCRAQEPPPRPPELKVLDRLVGQWKDEATFLEPKGPPESAIYTTRWVLGDRFLWSEGSSDGWLQAIQIMTFEPKQKEYRRWYFGSDEHPRESSGQWDEDARTLTWKGDLFDGGTGVSKWRFPDKDTIDWSRVLKDRDGKVESEVRGKGTRQKPAPVKLQERKKSRACPPHLKALEAYSGTWDTETINKVSEWNPKEVRTTGRVTNEWVLDGRFMLTKARESTGSEGIQLRTCDDWNKPFRAWHFDSKGSAVSSAGTWDAEARTMTWKGDLGNGITGTNRVRFAGTDSIEWKLVAKNGAGKVFLDMEGKFKRKK
jgi:hypothetical protein